MITPEGLPNLVRQWWRRYASLLTDTANYTPWLPRERMLDCLASGVSWQACHTSTFDFQTHRATLQDIDPGGFTSERVRAVIAVWWQTHRGALHEAAVDV